MLRWTTLCALACLGVDAAPPATLALWPQHINAQLSVSQGADGSSVVEASHGGALGTFSMKEDSQSEVPLDPLIDAIEIIWVPVADVQSSMLDQILANSLRFEKTSVEGIHLQAKLKTGAAWSEINETHHARLEKNVRDIFRSTLPTMEILDDRSNGFLAKSLCDFRTWKTDDPLQEVLGDPTAEAPGLCYSSSFPFTSMKDGASFFKNVVQNTSGIQIGSHDSAVEHALIRAKQDFSSVQRELRFAVIRLGREPSSLAGIEFEYLEAWIAGALDSKEHWSATLPTDKTQNDLLVVKSFGQDESLEYTWTRREGKLVVPASSSTVDIHVSKTIVPASVQATIAGEGFHRRYVMDVELLLSETSEAASWNKTIFVSMPVSSTAYIDLDEIRRMERFGELKLLSFTKHIEIERPSPISSQHVVGLKFSMPSTNQLHVEFLIHFRYQAPSETDLYRPAFVIAPNIFVLQEEDHLDAKSQELLEDAAVRDYFQTFGLISATKQSSSRWLRLSTEFPVGVTKVLTPVGYLPSDWLVSSVTLMCASLGAAILLWVSLGASNRAQNLPMAHWKGKV